jgi:hypothetical protein
MSFAPVRATTAAALAGALMVGGLVVTPAAAAIAGSRITTPADPSFFIADENAGTQTFAIAGTTTGGNPASNRVDINCYSDGSSVTIAKSVSLKPDGSFSLPKASLNNPLDLTCRLRAVPAGTNPSNLTPFSGPVIGVGERDLSKVSGGQNNGKTYDYYLDAQQQAAAFDYTSSAGARSRTATCTTRRTRSRRRRSSAMPASQGRRGRARRRGPTSRSTARTPIPRIRRSSSTRTPAASRL